MEDNIHGYFTCLEAFKWTTLAWVSCLKTFEWTTLIWGTYLEAFEWITLAWGTGLEVFEQPTLAWGTCLETLEWTTLALSVIAFKRHDSTQLQAQWNFWRGFIHVLAQTEPYTCLLEDFCMPHRKWESKN